VFIDGVQRKPWNKSGWAVVLTEKRSANSFHLEIGIFFQGQGRREFYPQSYVEYFEDINL
jgi:hypothetical protein